MVFNTFTSMVSAVHEVLEDDSLEVAAYIPTAIGLAEERLAKTLDYETFLTVVSATGTALSNITVGTSGTETLVSTPLDEAAYLYHTNVWYCGAKLDAVDISFVREINRLETSVVASARYYAIGSDPHTLHIAPPVSGGTFKVEYNKRTPSLSTANVSSKLLNYAGESLYHATLVEMSRFQKNWETIAVWEAALTESLQSNLNISRRARTDKGQKHQNTSETQSTTGVQ